MKKSFTKSLMVALFAAVLVGVNVLAFAGTKMKDIELDPGKGDNIGNQMKVFPTIATAQVAVHFFFETDDQVTMSVYDLQGRVVDPGAEGFVPKARLHESIVDVSTMNNGVYFVKLAQANGTTMTTKFMVQH